LALEYPIQSQKEASKLIHLDRFLPRGLKRHFHLPERHTHSGSQIPETLMRLTLTMDLQGSSFQEIRGSPSGAPGRLVQLSLLMSLFAAIQHGGHAGGSGNFMTY
jgi:hypothetical protein